jgi:hypothetical protein
MEILIIPVLVAVITIKIQVMENIRCNFEGILEP